MPDVPDYTNPVLDADWPDPDAVRFGEEFVMVASSFNRAPGLPVLRSPDLVRWTHAGNALPANVPAEHFALPRHGGGVWAPSIRAHDGRLVIVYPDPDHGIYTIWADRPEGPWSTPHLLMAGSGLIDPCPLWDDDGRAYLVHGWANSRAGVKNRLTMIEVDEGLTRLLGPGRLVVDADTLEGYTTLEGPKLYKRDGWYWIFAPAGGVATGWQSVFRSRSIWGPYEHRTVLAQGSSDVNGPHQGAWVTDVAGDDWFLHFQDRGPYGRVVHLQPMGWGEDGWPWMGQPGPDGIGEPVRSHRRPACAEPGGAPVPPSPVSDDFTSPGLGPVWHWQANPEAGWARTGDGALELAHLPTDRGDVRDLPQVLGQLLPGWPVSVRVRLRLGSTIAGSRVGLTVLGLKYSWVGLRRGDDGAAHLIAALGNDRQCETQVSTQAVPGDAVEILLTSPGDESVAYAWRTQGDDWQPVLEAPVTEGHWIGAEIGLFAAAPEGTDNPGHSRIELFEVTPS
jgi:hypothetical protein